ncbi:MAG: hypothetical protein ACLQPD_03360 [Desulfomonilaceae bacterium]
MKHFFIVVLVIRTADAVIVIVWIIRPPVERRGDSYPQKCLSLLYSMASFFVYEVYRL